MSLDYSIKKSKWSNDDLFDILIVLSFVLAQFREISIIVPGLIFVYTAILKIRKARSIKRYEIFLFCTFWVSLIPGIYQSKNFLSLLHYAIFPILIFININSGIRLKNSYLFISTIIILSCIVPNFGVNNRLMGLVGNENTNGVLAIFAYFLVYYYNKNTKIEKLFLIFTVIIVLLGKGRVNTLILTLFLILKYLKFKRSYLVTIYFGVFFSLALIFLLYVYFPVTLEILSSITVGGRDVLSFERSDTYYFILENIKNNVHCGLGEANNFIAGRASSSHNAFLRLGLEAGIVSMAMYIIIHFYYCLTAKCNKQLIIHISFIPLLMSATMWPWGGSILSSCWLVCAHLSGDSFLVANNRRIN